MAAVRDVAWDAWDTSYVRQGVPEAVVERARELVEAALLQQGASSGSAVAFAGATTWDLPKGSWATIRPEAKRRIKRVKRWGEFMLGAIPAVLPAESSQGSSGGSVTLSSAQLAELMKQAVAAALVAQSGGAGPREARRGFASRVEAPGAEAREFPEMRWAVPALEDEDCDIDELPGTHAATLDHLYALVQLLREWVRDMQDFVGKKEPSATFVDVMEDSFAGKRARDPSPPSPAKRAAPDPAGGGPPPLTERRRAELAQQAAGMRTVTEEQLQQALNGTLDPATLLKAAGASSLRPVIPKHGGGELEGLDLRVYLGVDLDTHEKGLVLGEDGKLSCSGPKARSRCTMLAEWERGFCTVLRKVKTDRQHRLLVYFKDRFHYKAAMYGVLPLIKFYKFFTLRMEEDPTVTIGVASYSELFTEYTREQGLRPIQPKKPWGPRDTCAPRGGDPRQPTNPTTPTVARDAKGGGSGRRAGLSTFAGTVARRTTRPGTRRASAGRISEGAATARRELRRQASRTVAGGRKRAPGGLGLRASRVGGAAGGVLVEAPGAHVVLSRVGRGWRADAGGAMPWMSDSGLRAGGGAETGVRGKSGEVELGGRRAPAGEEVREMAMHSAAAGSTGDEREDGGGRYRGAREGKVEADGPFRVPNYVGKEHEEAMEREIEKELPVWDFSRPVADGVNARIDLDKDKFSTVKDAYALLRPGLWMVKVDLDSAYHSVGVASQFRPAQCFEWGGVRYMDVRAPFGNRALPGILMRYTRAIVAWMHAQGVPCVGYLDDFFMVADGREEAGERMMLLVEFVSFLGFKVNSAKCEGPAQVMEFLGVLLSTEGPKCTAAINEDRVAFVLSTAKEVRELATRGPVRRRKLESLWGLLAFSSQIVYGLTLYTRKGFSSLVAAGGRAAVKVTPPLLEDLTEMEQVIKLYNGRVVQHREDVKDDFFSTDASKTKGMGGVLDFRFFLMSWEDLKRRPRRPWFPFRPGHVTGRTIVVNIDNQCALRQVAKWWGPPEYLPLLKELFKVCVKFDIRLRPRYITTKDNKLADLLSKLRLREFHLEHRAFMRASVWKQDRDDWMLDPVEWCSLDREFGPFTLDASVAPSRDNAFCAVSRSREEDARVQRFDGHQAWGNLPFSIMYDISLNFLCCKKRQQLGTAGTFLVPVWEKRDGKAPDPTWELVSGLPQGVLEEQRRYEEEALARSTRGSYSTGVKAFVTFCIVFACLGCLDPLSATNDTLVWFITFSSWFVTPGTIKNYLAGGVRRYWDRPSKPVMPLTSQNLREMARHVDFGSLSDLSLRTTILVGFFGLFRKDNLMAGKEEEAFNSRRLMMLTTERAGDSPLFVTEKVVGEKVQVVPLTHTELVAGIKRLAAAAGLRPEAYAGHSLRRGGATAAKKLEVLGMYIKAQGIGRVTASRGSPDQRLILLGAIAEAATVLGAWETLHEGIARPGGTLLKESREALLEGEQYAEGEQS
ncbi:hypothetical protein CYMTET_15020 [Cymbomonas tetramitiformis]|uniref:Reverse transcriptase domain-containing protein n=1 Tax=Cymbomonas tetramitiformis TaxID=36881 RepID=A0AAE0GF74_9CHLO|nr:hypothetical protein CYMTET_15020 [Cymbomonas tetramitiformis]